MENKRGSWSKPKFRLSPSPNLKCELVSCLVGGGDIAVSESERSCKGYTRTKSMGPMKACKIRTVTDIFWGILLLYSERASVTDRFTNSLPRCSALCANTDWLCLSYRATFLHRCGERAALLLAVFLKRVLVNPGSAPVALP